MAAPLRYQRPVDPWGVEDSPSTSGAIADGPAPAFPSGVRNASRLLVFGCCLVATGVLLPQVAGELLLARGLALAGPLPSPPTVTDFTREHGLLLASLDPERTSFEPEPWPGFRIVSEFVAVARWQSKIPGSLEKPRPRPRNQLGVEKRLSWLLVQRRPLQHWQHQLATLAVARHLAERWSTAEQLEFLRSHEWFGPCGTGVDAASRRCFHVAPSSLSNLELARLIRRAQHGGSSCRFKTGEQLVATAGARGWIVADGRRELRVPDCVEPMIVVETSTDFDE